MQPISEPFDTRSHRYSMILDVLLRLFALLELLTSYCEWRSICFDSAKPPTCFEVLTPLVYFLKDFWNILRAYNVNWIFTFYLSWELKIGAAVRQCRVGPYKSNFHKLMSQLTIENEKRKRFRKVLSTHTPWKRVDATAFRQQYADRRHGVLPTSRCSPYVTVFSLRQNSLHKNMHQVLASSLLFTPPRVAYLFVSVHDRRYTF